MSPADILDEYALKEGWNTDYQLAICITYIENQQSEEAFRDHLENTASFDHRNDVSGV